MGENVVKGKKRKYRVSVACPPSYSTNKYVRKKK